MIRTAVGGGPAAGARGSHGRPHSDRNCSKGRDGSCRGRDRRCGLRAGPVPTRTAGPSAVASGTPPAPSPTAAPTAVPSPSITAPSSPSPSPSAAADVSPLALRQCDEAGFIPCAPQAVELSIPLAGTGLALTWSSDWVASKGEMPGWSADSLGLGGWSTTVVQRYDPATGTLLPGSGAWRLVESPLGIDGGRTAVPTFDGTRAFVFDTAGRHVQTVDARLGMTLTSIEYDADGRLSSVHGTSDLGPVGLTVERAADGTATGIRGIDGGEIPLELDREGRLAAVLSPSGGAYRVAYGEDGLAVAFIDPAGGLTRYGYDAAGRVASITDADGVRVDFERTDGPNTGFTVAMRTAAGVTTTFAVDATEGGGMRRTWTGSGGEVASESVDSSGHRSVRLPDGTVYDVGAAPSGAWALRAPIATPYLLRRPDGAVVRVDREEALVPAAPGRPFPVSGSITTTVNGAVWRDDFDLTTRSWTQTDPAVGRPSTPSTRPVA